MMWCVQLSPLLAKRAELLSLMFPGAPPAMGTVQVHQNPTDFSRVRVSPLSLKNNKGRKAQQGWASDGHACIRPLKCIKT